MNLDLFLDKSINLSTRKPRFILSPLQSLFLLLYIFHINRPSSFLPPSCYHITTRLLTPAFSFILSNNFFPVQKLVEKTWKRAFDRRLFYLLFPDFHGAFVSSKTTKWPLRTDHQRDKDLHYL
ncbi:hypothetical protein L2E82_04437 [Cichorium intybus]|uniref:Uncharacterized protein n=1 Tax=Cichorium intybus TaxID=13427 RepID=A0ACB9H614_CICIN|nr:hypothetical protein L2E82_04437 [Cichorium intybus]